ncbi:MAG: DNA-directed RNA polymerase subunit beta' [Phycisphaerales bacterium]|nr:DNA-directed RNA polymerase subunit beta' [Phycisphaerales bacterium]
MVDTVFDRVNDFGSVKITLASPNDIRSWSFGEVKKPETINYRTYRPEKDGLFCERIFGPERDYECACGKYKGTKFKGIICDRCGVKVTHSRVRRKRMGHINLAAPIVHIWFFKALPSRLGTLLSMKTADLEKVIYFQDYAVIDPGTTDLEPRQILTEDEHRTAVEKYGSSAFRCSMGADAVRELLEELDLHEVAATIREDLEKTRSKQKIRDLSKRLKLVEQIKNSENDVTWMVMDVVPVIPPDLRPLVLLESGNFATSDLNDLYRRIINRNNRLKKLMDLNAPEVIIRNEKRMLQQAVDALFDNGRCRRPVLGSSNRPLKSLTDMIKGKQGRFRENLLGKRVDYSARSVIVVGPELKLHQCGLPKKIALELYQPFIIRRLKEHGLADTIKSAKRMLERRDPEVWDILEQVIYQHPVLLNRAPTLHRMGIQAFEPVLVEGNAITLHPLVCTGYNADFDGDQMAVHLPLSLEAQVEAHVLMLSTHNIFSPADGRPIVSPSQDIVMGVYFLTTMLEEPTPEKTRYSVFAEPHEAILAYDHKTIDLHEPIYVRLKNATEVVDNEGGTPSPIQSNKRVLTTVGRVLFNDVLDPQIPFYNCTLGKKGCSAVIDDTYRYSGRPATLELLDAMKEVGFKTSTVSGLSIGIADMRIPTSKSDLIAETQKRVDRVEKSYSAGAITERERHNQLLDLWAHCREQITQALVETLKNDRRDPTTGDETPINSDEGAKYLNPVYLMSTSGARGNISQMQQLAGMRGLMAKPSGEIIETPIRSNFREGLNVLEYFSSTHGARKGLADTALKTADSGYLTRKLYDVAQGMVITEQSCKTKLGVPKRAVYKGKEIDVPLRELILGRTSRQTIINPMTDKRIVAENQIITADIAKRIEELGIDSVQVRSPLTCETSRGCCVACYGMDLSTGQAAEEGLAVGTIAAQSIGEPGTQLTMRTFHTGGVATRATLDPSHRAENSGTVEIRDCNEVDVKNPDGVQTIALKRNGEVAVIDDRGRELEKHKVEYGSVIRVKAGETIRKGKVLVEWDPHRTPILAERTGTVRFKDILTEDTVREEETPAGKELIVVAHTGEKHPQILIEDESGNVLDFHHLPAKARIEVEEGQPINMGEMLARLPSLVAGSADIVGGLPRVTEIFEARIPKDPAVTSEISGRVELHPDKRKGKMTIRVINEAGLELDHHVAQGKRLLVHTNDHVKAGDRLTEGPEIPSDILKIKGEEALYSYMLDEVQNVYRAQGVPIADKHIETILTCMLSKVQIEQPGDTYLLPNDVVDKYAFRDANRKIAKQVRVTDTGETSLVAGQMIDKDAFKEANDLAEGDGKQAAKSKRARPAMGKTLLLGITKASLQSESFLSGASFQETTKVLTEASLRGAVDNLVGLKENVLLGHLIPAGTGFDPYLRMQVQRLVEPPISMEEEEEAMLAEAVEAAEALGAEPLDSGSGFPDDQIPNEAASLAGESEA